MYIWCKSSVEQILTNTRQGPKDTNKMILDSGLNMNCYGQIALRDNFAFSINGVSAQKLPEGVSFEYNFLECIKFNDGVPYPDIVSKKKTMSVLSHYTQSILISFSISEKAKKGKYLIPVTIDTSVGNFSAKITLNIYNVTIPEPKNSSLGHEYFLVGITKSFPAEDGKPTPLKNWTNPYNYPAFSEKWWDLLKEYARTLKFLRANRLFLPLTLLLKKANSKRISKEEWHFDFSLVDKFIDLFLAEGSFNSIILEGLTATVYGKFVLAINENGEIKKFKTSTEDAYLFLKSIYKSTYEYFDKKGLLSYLKTHVQDEPHTDIYWKKASKVIRECMPNIPCGEPLDNQETALKLEGYMDFNIPRLEVYDKNIEYYQKLQEKGVELWVYSCCFPEENWWLNKFIDLPPMFSRYMEWACFSQNVKGFLHWGFAFWVSKFYGLSKLSRYKGDGFIIYPDGENNSVLLSIRAVATHEGTVDYDLLSMLKEKDKDLAMQISKSVAKGFHDFNKDSSCVSRARRKLLKLLDK